MWARLKQHQPATIHWVFGFFSLQEVVKNKGAKIACFLQEARKFETREI
jgi:hypothetical protein